MTETPKCPYCGGKMIPNEDEVIGAWYYCSHCFSVGPVKGTPEEALAAALHRAEPDMRPLTLEEVWEKVDDKDWNFLWLEYSLSSYVLQIIPRNRSKTYFYFLIPGDDEEERKEPMVEINKEWRCWPRKPTKEQMEAEKWEE